MSDFELLNKYYFTGNPIIITDDREDEGPMRSFVVSVGRRKVYEGHYVSPFRADISQIIRPYIGYYPDADTRIDNSEPISLLADFYEINNYVTVDISDLQKTTEFYAVPGGVSRQNWRRFQKLGIDIFCRRFFNPTSNFFFTTRTAGWVINLKETELEPLYFMFPEDEWAGTLVITENVSGAEYRYDYDSGVFALDIDRLRRWFFDHHGVLPASFDVSRNGVIAARVIVTASDPARERYRIRFRNSLGLFEIIELTGKLQVTPSIVDSESDFQRYDIATDDFVTTRERLEMRRELSIDVLLQRETDVEFFLDMVASDEAWLLDLYQLPVKVIPAIEDVTHDARMESPLKVTLRLALTENDTQFTPVVTDGTEASRGRIFTPQFNDKFN